MITRFAPSPSGLLHLGHAYAAWVAHCWGEPIRLRIEDIDQAVCRAEFRKAILDDLHWLGIPYHPAILQQSSRFAVYRGALEVLQGLEVVYPCFCSRSDIRRARMAHAPHGRGIRYPGTCRALAPQEAHQRISEGKPYAWRLDGFKAQTLIGEAEFVDHRFGRHSASLEVLGDRVIARKDGLMSYHLAVVCDDADEGIELVTRGEDLLEMTPLHVVLQKLLGLPTPHYLHHHLVRDEEGVRLAKRADAQSLRSYRERGYAPEEVFALMPKAAEDFPSPL